MTRALTLAAIEHCARDGHEFRWVRAWHDCGFYECARCGETRAKWVVDEVNLAIAAHNTAMKTILDALTSEPSESRT